MVNLAEIPSPSMFRILRQDVGRCWLPLCLSEGEALMQAEFLELDVLFSLIIHEFGVCMCLCLQVDGAKVGPTVNKLLKYAETGM
jgi:hypothetical protein